MKKDPSINRLVYCLQRETIQLLFLDLFGLKIYFNNINYSKGLNTALC